MGTFDTNTPSEVSMATLTAEVLDGQSPHAEVDEQHRHSRTSTDYTVSLGGGDDSIRSKGGGLGHTEITVDLDFADLRFTPPKSRNSREPQREILHGLSGSAKAGEVLAVMGPSGGGKTSLLNILSSRTTRGVEGQIYLNGHPRTTAAKRVTGYVMQKDIFFETLTVYETILYTALLRLQRNMSYAEKVERVMEVIRELGLEKCMHTKLGTAQQRGISGGELKRVNIANELIFNPAMCILDEPTSGLDSAAAMSLVENLMTLAKKWRRTIIMSIHQPSSQIFAKFDRLVLMMNGHIVFQGLARNTYAYFASLGFECPRGFNIADFVMDILADDANEPALLAAYRERVRYDSSLGYRMELPDTQLPNSPAMSEDAATRASSPSVFESKSAVEGHNAHVKQLASDASLTIALRQHPELDPSYLYQIWVLMRRGYRKEARGVITVLEVAQTILVGVIIGFLWFQSLANHKESKLMDQAGLLFFVAAYFGWVPVFNELSTFPDEKPIIARERSSKSYPVSTYFFAKMFSSLSISYIMPTLLFIIVYPMTGMEATVRAILATYCIMLLSVTVGNSYGAMLAVCCEDFKMSSVVGSVTLLLIDLGSGFFVANDSIPVWFRWVKWLSFMDYVLTAYLHVHHDNKIFECDVGTLPCPVRGEDFLLQQNRITPLWGCIVGLLGFFFVFRTVNYLVLRFSRQLKMC